MKLICSKANLLKGVNIVSKAVPTRTTMAILECILIDASANEIKLMANDMELGIETIIDGTIEERGIIALDAKIFSEIVRKLPDNDVTIVTDPSFKTVISCEKAKFNIVGKSGDDFSYIPYMLLFLSFPHVPYSHTPLPGLLSRHHNNFVALTFVSSSLLYPSQPVSDVDSRSSVKVSSFASVLSAKFSATASISAGFFGEPYSSSP